MTLFGVIGEILFLIGFCILIFGFGLVIWIIDFIFTILFLLHKKVFRT